MSVSEKIPGNSRSLPGRAGLTARDDTRWMCVHAWLMLKPLFSLFPYYLDEVEWYLQEALQHKRETKR